MKNKLSTLKMEIFCFVVNRNTYVRDEYQLPIDLDKEFHRKHRIYDWVRLLKLLFIYRILKKKPSKEKLLELEEMRKKRDSILGHEIVIGNQDKIVDDSEKIRELFQCEIIRIMQADLLRFSKYKNVICIGNASDESAIYVYNKLQEACQKLEYFYRLVRIENNNIKKNDMEFLSTFFLPIDVYDENSFLEKECFTLTQEEEREVDNSLLLSTACRSLACLFPSANERYIKFIVSELYSFFSLTVEYLSPVAVLIWDNSWIYTEIVKQVISDKEIPCCFLEKGEIPNTFSMDKYGFFGKSYRGRYHGWKAWNPSVTDLDLNNANKVKGVWEKRKVGEEENVTFDIEKIDWNRPIVLFCGQDDFKNGLFPYTEEAMKYGSPLFSSSYKACLFIMEICKKRHWNLICIPHSNMIKYQFDSEGQFTDSIVDGTNCDIEFLIPLVDVMVTIGDYASYEVLAYGKPVVLLGNMKLSGQGCCYEAHSKADIESLMDEAINQGLSFSQSKNYIEQIAYLNKYYLYEMCANKKNCFGQPIEKAARFLHECIISE